jgi:hypothetical protein
VRYDQPVCPRCITGRMQYIRSLMVSIATFHGEERIDVDRVCCLNCKTYLDLRPMNPVEFDYRDVGEMAQP